ncbi:sulfotransferase [Falsirhodobacter sp. 20TX0035]|uniref:sulfotransferase n=1 Tax=Falsirhodobacter sp. 20TX0035 TaxID=3022019 RepID=UPI00232B196B|nr:sulfotransferase [Falsirhodobacter sp. 20TX0035]MDB6454368.1 sulfotransferase [Falsirhodobacter sp. 20TX0035]
MTQAPTLVLGMGAAKAGTSWLFDQLAGHRDCHLRGIKELHYFNTALHDRWALQVRRIEARVARSVGALRDDLSDWLAVLRHNRLNLRAYAGYLCKGREGQKVVADFTPAYGLLPQRMLSRLALLPDVKMIYMLRDPVERLWSNVRMEAARTARWPWMAGLLARRGMENALSGRGPSWARSDYAGALTRLDRAIGPDRLHVMFYEEMTQPTALARLAAFLGISDLSVDMGKRVNGGVAAWLPSSMRARARRVLTPQYEYVQQRVGRVPAAWHGSMVGF